MFTPFKSSMEKIEIKEHIEWIQDIFKHLSLSHIEEPKKLSPQTDLLLTEIGLIEKKINVKEYEDFFSKHVNFVSWSDFITLINKINHFNEYCIIPKLCKKCRNKAFDEYPHDSAPKMIDLFCGSGGMSLGFKQVGFQTVFANDIEESCIQTYAFNHPEISREKIVHGDIKDLAHVVHRYVENDDIDLLIGGPPCQGFSSANKQRIIDDPRNKLYKEFVKVVQKVKPKFFVMENVEGMKNIAGQVKEDFLSIGYNIDYSLMNAYDFGVPQNRKRLIFIGNRIGVESKDIISNIFISLKGIQNTTLKDAIGDLPVLEPLRKKNATKFESDESGRLIMIKNHSIPNKYVDLINGSKQFPFLYNHKARYNNDRDIEIFSRLNQGDKSDDPKIADIMPYASRNTIFKDKYFKLIYDQPSKTITAHMKFDCNMYIHPTQARGLTPREAARVQSYPDDYYFKGSFTKTYMQIGNSVPPLMAKKIGEEIIKYI